MANPLAGKHILVVEDEYFIASDLKRMLGAQDAIIVGPVGDLETGLSLAEPGRILFLSGRGEAEGALGAAHVPDRL
jgi:hypothetical protein